MEINKIMDKITEGRQYRNIQEIGADESEKRVTGYATTFNEPYELFRIDNYIFREQIDPNAFKECDMQDVIMQYNHEGRVFARRSNGTLDLTVDNHGLFISADLSGTEIGRNLYEEIKGGYTNKMSFGFRVKEDTRVVTENHDTGIVDVLRTITKIEKLYDVSAVSIPANDGTEISARSYCEGVIAELEAERLQIEQREKQKRKIRLLTEM